MAATITPNLTDITLGETADNGYWTGTTAKDDVQKFIDVYDATEDLFTDPTQQNDGLIFSAETPGEYTKCMEANRGQVFIRGIDKVIRLDLAKHKDILVRSKGELDAFKQAVSYQVKRKKYYKAKMETGEYDKEAMQKSMDMISIDIRHMSDKVKLSNEAIDHHKLIVDTLTGQLEDYNNTQASLAQATEDHASGN